jgi:hypothetical protein
MDHVPIKAPEEWLIFQLAIFDDTGGSENCIGALPIGL